jgi:type IV pilus assembly protein PilA
MRDGSSLTCPVQHLSQPPKPLLRWAAALVMLLLASSTWAVQSRPTTPAAHPRRPAAKDSSAQPKSDADWEKYSGVIAELAKIQTKLQQELQFPAPRGQSRLLPLLPESTVLVAALPNYGDTLHQAAQIFQREREENATLRNWWKNDVGADGKKIDDALDRIYQLSQYLGDEVVLSGSMRGKSPAPLFLAEIKKPGLKELLLQVDKELSDKGKPALRVLEPKDLAAASAAGEDHPGDNPIVLVRPDYLVVAFDLATLRESNSQLEKNSSSFTSTAFGQRMAQAYSGGAGVVLSVDLQKILAALPQKNDKELMAFQNAGFADMKYLIWEHKDMAGRSTSQTELSFTGPRRGVASWLARPARLGGLDFISPKSPMVIALELKNLAEIFEDVREMATASNPDAFAPLVMAEGQMQINIKQDLLSKLAGEIVLALDPSVKEQPEWKVALRVNDTRALQQTFARLLATVPVESHQQEENGVMYRSIVVPSGPKPLEITYAFVDGYLLVAPSHTAVAEAVQAHRDGGSLARSADFQSWLAPGHSAEASGFVYQNLGPMLAPMMAQMPADMGRMLSQIYSGTQPTVLWLYGENTAIREAHSSGSFDMGMMLVGAAVAIPNLIRSKNAANESAAVSTVRTLNTAEITYATTYPKKGYARSLALMGPAPNGNCDEAQISPAHACLLDGTLGCSTGLWCTKNGFKFRVTGICTTLTCSNYLAVATPLSEAAGMKSFCSTSDAVIRMRTGPPLTSLTVAECQKWKPLAE